MADAPVTATEAGRILGMHRTEVSRRAQPGGVLEHAVVEPARGRKAARFSRRSINVYAAALRDQRELDPQHERARRDRASADMQEFKLRVEQGEYLPHAVVERMQVAEATAVKNILLAWSTTIADSLHRAAVREDVHGVEAVLDRAVRDVLLELADPERPIECPHCGADMTAEAPPATTTCGAPTKAGTPCTRPAGGGGRCYQHVGREA